MHLPTIRQSLQQLQQEIRLIYEEGEAKAIAQLTLEHLLQMNRLSLQINGGQTLTALQSQQLQEIGSRLLQKEPVQYILGESDFYGLKLKVNPSVLIPRQETEELVQWILQSVSSSNRFSTAKTTSDKKLQILDIGVGSGCISLALKKHLPQADIMGIDVSEAALKVAQFNSGSLQLPIQWQKIDVLNRTLWGLLPKFDLIVSNPPYICESEKHILEDHVVNHEPSIALFVKDSDSLIFYSTIADLALLKLKKNGKLFFEVSAHFGENCRDMLQNKGFSQVELQKDMNGKWRMIKAYS